MNDEIQSPTRDTLFDEKIGGTCHVALGMAFPECGGTNTSGLHWDLVCDLRRRRRDPRRRRGDLAGRAVPVSDPRDPAAGRRRRRTSRSSCGEGDTGPDPGAGDGRAADRRARPRGDSRRRDPARAGVGRRGSDEAYLARGERRAARPPARRARSRRWTRSTPASRCTRPGTPASSPAIDPAKIARRSRAAQPLMAQFMERSAVGRPALVRDRVSVRGVRPGRRHVARRVRGLRVPRRAGCTRTIRSARGGPTPPGCTTLADRLSQVRELRVLSDGHRPHGRRRGAHLDRRQGRPQLPRRRGVHRARRDGHERRGAILLPRRHGRARGRGRAPAVRGRPGRQERGRERRGLPAPDAGDGRRRDGAGRVRDRHELRASRSSRARSCSTRRSAGRATWRSAPATPTRAARTCPGSTGTWCATCGPAPRSTPTASRSTATGSSCPRSSPRTSRPGLDSRPGGASAIRATCAMNGRSWTRSTSTPRYAATATTAAVPSSASSGRPSGSAVTSLCDGASSTG